MRIRSLLVALAPVIVAAGCSSSNPPEKPAAAPSVSCAVPNARPACWQQVRPLGSGGWPPGTGNEPEFAAGKFPLGMAPQIAFGGALWMIAQSYAYSSPDGLAWKQENKSDWGGRIYESIVFFRDQLWMFGGLDYDSREFRNDIWVSNDGITWKKSGPAAWPARGGQAMAVFQDKLWLFGGANHIKEDRGTDAFLNDVWVSNDGLQWEQVTGAAPWSPRDNAGIEVLGDALYLVGGSDKADVWRSTDGKQWTELTDDAPWHPRTDYAHVVLDDKLWVFGGWAGKSTNALNDVWYSADGTTWTRQTEHAAWSPRGPMAAAFRNKIWIYSGKHTGADDNWGGDLWQMAGSVNAS